MSEQEVYDAIYQSSAHKGYGHSNHGRDAVALVRDAKSLVDIGCGHNEFVRGIEVSGIRAVGVDFACPSADVIACATALPFADKEFDVATSFDALEHLLPEQVPTALREIARVSHRFCFSICHRASVITWQGRNLHPTVQSESWWIDRIREAGAEGVAKQGRYLTGTWTQPRKLTIGMLVHDDFDGAYFTIQSLRLHHAEAMPMVEFVVLDNNPASKHGEALGKFCEWVKDVPTRYIKVEHAKSTSLRNLVFEHARTPFVLCLDCHVLLCTGAVSRLIRHMETDAGNLLHGPLLYDNLSVGATHMEPTWRDGMWGIWAVDDRGLDADATPFEIPAHGMGAFACRKDSWLGFNSAFRGFGGEECYIHEKFRKAGRKVVCLPFLRWLHRFARPAGTTYPNQWEDRIRNYLIGHRELGLDPTPVIQHFNVRVSPSAVQAALASMPPSQAVKDPPAVRRDLDATPAKAVKKAVKPPVAGASRGLAEDKDVPVRRPLVRETRQLGKKALARQLVQSGIAVMHERRPARQKAKASP